MPDADTVAGNAASRPAPIRGRPDPKAVLLRPWRIVTFFVVVSLIWIVGTDFLLQKLVSDPVLYARLQAFKGVLFVALLASLLFFLLRSARNDQLVLNRQLQEYQGDLEEQVRRRTAQLYQSREQLRRLTRRIQSLSESERKAISRELHDAMGSHLTNLKIDLQAVRKGLSAEKDLQRLDVALGFVDAMYQSVRKLAAELRPAVIDEFGLAAGLEWLAGNFRQRWDGVCSLSVDGYDLPPNEARDTALFRICQESLTNVLKHAQANEVFIGLQVHNGQIVRLTVEDDGRGIIVGGQETDDHLGLVGMRERAMSAGGTLSVEPRGGGGTRVLVELPVVRPADTGKVIV